MFISPTLFWLDKSHSISSFFGLIMYECNEMISIICRSHWEYCGISVYPSSLLCWSSEMHLYSSRRLSDPELMDTLFQRCCCELESIFPSLHSNSISVSPFWKPFVLLTLHGKFLVSPADTAHFLLFSSISKGGSRKTPSGRVAESRRYRRKTSVRCSNLRRRLLAWTRSSSQVPGAQHPPLNCCFLPAHSAGDWEFIVLCLEELIHEFINSAINGSV